MTFELRKNIALYFLSLFLASLFLIVVIVALIIRQHEGREMGWDAIAAMTIFCLAFSAPLILTTDYFIEDFSKKIVMEDESITVEKNKRKTVFTKSDIKHFYLIKVKRYSYSNISDLASYFKYFIIVTRTGEFIYATNLICNSEEFIEAIGLPVEEINTWFPYIDKAVGKGDLS